MPATTYPYFTRTMLGNGWIDENITITSAQAGNSVSNSAKRILFVWRNDSNGGTQPPAAVDDITLISTCVGPTTSAATGITASTATANWNAYSGATTYDLRYRPVGSVSWSEITSISGTTQQLTNLSPSLQYEYQVKSNNCVAWSASATFITACGAITPTHSNNFSTFPGTCWTQASGGTPATGSTGTSNFWAADGFLNNGTTGAAKMNIYGNNRAGWLFSPLFDLSAGGYRLSFDYGLTAFGNTSTATLGSDDVIHVLISSDGGTTWNVLQTWNSTTPISNTVNQFLIDLNGYVSPTTKIAVYGSSTISNSDTDFFIDNFVVDPIPSCFPVTSLLLGTPTTTTLPVSWTAPAQTPANGYEIYYSITNSAPTSATVLNGSNSVSSTNTNATINSLAPTTTYYVWVRSNCGAGDFSTWSSAGSATTLCSSTNVPYSLDFGTVSTLPACTSVQNAGTGNNWAVNSTVTTGYSGSRLQYSYNSSNPADAWFFTQGLNLSAGTTYYISFKYGNNSTTYIEKLKVGVGTSAAESSMTTIADYPTINTNTPQLGQLTFTPTTTDVYFFGFNAYSAANQFYLYLDDISVSDQTSAIIWDGAQWSNTSGPDSSTPAIINGNYNGGSFSASNLTISQGVTVTMNGGIEATDIVNNGTLILGNSGTVVYSGTYSASSTGIFKVNKDVTSVAAVPNKYKFWSSPVVSQSMFGIFDVGTPQFVTELDLVTNTWKAVAAPANSVRGKGYSIKTPDAATIATFTGLPNNGNISVTIAAPNAADNYVLLGNPYPSMLSLTALTTANTTKLNGNYWFWANAQKYYVYNDTSGVWTEADLSTTAPGIGNVVMPAQGFLAEAKQSATSVSFTNTMRSVGSGNYFNKVVGNNSLNEGKFWLRMKSAQGESNAAVITYGYGTNGVDDADAKSLNTGENHIFTLLENERYAIQGKANFVQDDKVALGISFASDAQYTLALTKSEGIFANAQTVILHDKATNIYHNLNEGAYTFNAEKGDNENRFELIYRKAAELATVSKVNVAKNGEVFTVTSPEPILSVELYDASGRLVQKFRGGSTSLDLNISARGAYVVNIITVKETVSKKIIK